MHPTIDIPTRIAGVVVLFHPTEEVISTIDTYVHQVEKLFLIDNSEIVDSSLVNRLCENENVEYISNGGNKGIAQALNRGADLALKSGYPWLLTMDQDTHLPKNYVGDLLNVLKGVSLSSVGIIAPRYGGAKETIVGHYQNVLVTMTSGNLLKLEAYTKVGPFLESFFIDHVDHEYCLRLACNGYSIVQVNAITLTHRPGKVIRLSLFGYTKEYSTHSPVRFYYFCRNGYYVVSKYHKLHPLFTRFFIRLWFIEVFKILFQDKKFFRIQLLIRSISDFYKGIQGKLIAK